MTENDSVTLLVLLGKTEISARALCAVAKQKEGWYHVYENPDKHTSVFLRYEGENEYAFKVTQATKVFGITVKEMESISYRKENALQVLRDVLGAL
ncbi:MAG: hypothetical protein KatS3mg054_0240 [Chloroflexus sp.]|nr:MAG: hypothetical protein KatS3mg054_0175 [Chloroflexus sp.]GIV86211.1 MAG: hypothetical protein KatS3mg054_0240 [Chloroflexus sp.]